MADTLIIEANDISRVLTTGTLVTLPDGSQGLAVVLALNPAADKAYPDGETAFPEQIRLGVNLYQVEPLNLTTTLVSDAAQEAPAAIPAADAAPVEPVTADPLPGAASDPAPTEPEPEPETPATPAESSDLPAETTPEAAPDVTEPATNATTVLPDSAPSQEA